MLIRKPKRTRATPPPPTLSTSGGDVTLSPPPPATKRPRGALPSSSSSGGLRPHVDATAATSPVPPQTDSGEEEEDVKATAEEMEDQLLQTGNGLTGDALLRFLDDDFMKGLGDVEQLCDTWAGRV